MTPEQVRLKAKILGDIRRTIAKCEQTILAAAYWNSINPDEHPLDVEPERVTIFLYRRVEEKLLASKGWLLDVKAEIDGVLATLRSGIDDGNEAQP